MPTVAALRRLGQITMPSLQFRATREGATRDAIGGGLSVNTHQSQVLSRIDTRRVTVGDVQLLHRGMPRFLALWLLRGGAYRRNEDGTYQFQGR